MTTPAPAQKNTKAWVALIGGLLADAIPLILQFAGYLPPPWGAVASGIGVIISAITGKAVHQVSNAPKGTVLVPAPVSSDGTYDNPYRAS